MADSPWEQAYDEGRQAALGGLPEKANPYSLGADDGHRWQAWSLGWSSCSGGGRERAQTGQLGLFL